MQSSRRPKTLIEAERHSLEFTSGQLIIAICGLLFLWLVGFLMGVMAGRLEFGSSLAEGKKPAEAVQTASKTDPKGKTPPAAKPAAEKGKPAVKDIPAPPAPKPAEAKPVEAKAVEPKPAPPAEAKKPEAEIKYVTERPDRPTMAATQTQAEAATPAEASKPLETAIAAASAAATAASAPAEATKPAEKAETPTEVAKAETADKPKEESAPKAEAKASGKSYTVQVFSVKAQNRSNADEYVSLLKQNSGLTAEVVKSKDGKHYNVIIGRYPERKAAEEKRDELKKKAGFADCIVREIS